MSLGNRLIHARSLAGFSRTQLQRTSKVPYSTIASIEDNDTKQSSHTPTLARALGVDSYWLSTGEGEPGRAMTAIPGPRAAAGTAHSSPFASLAPTPGSEILSADEALLIAGFRALTDGQRHAVQQLVSGLAVDSVNRQGRRSRQSPIKGDS